MQMTIIVVEAGDGYTDEVRRWRQEVADLAEACAAVTAEGYRVMADSEGGCCAWYPVGLYDDPDECEPRAIVTVYPTAD